MKSINVPVVRAKIFVKMAKDSFNGKQKYHCLDCNSYGTLNAGPKYSFARKKKL